MSKPVSASTKFWVIAFFTSPFFGPLFGWLQIQWLSLLTGGDFPWAGKVTIMVLNVVAILAAAVAGIASDPDA